MTGWGSFGFILLHLKLSSIMTKTNLFLVKTGTSIILSSCSKDPRHLRQEPPLSFPSPIESRVSELKWGWVVGSVRTDRPYCNVSRPYVSSIYLTSDT